jgi:hypothetical protein
MGLAVFLTAELVNNLKGVLFSGEYEFNLSELKVE